MLDYAPIEKYTKENKGLFTISDVDDRLIASFRHLLETYGDLVAIHNFTITFIDKDLTGWSEEQIAHWEEFQLQSMRLLPRYDSIGWDTPISREDLIGNIKPSEVVLSEYLGNLADIMGLCCCRLILEDKTMKFLEIQTEDPHFKNPWDLSRITQDLGKSFKTENRIVVKDDNRPNGFAFTGDAAVMLQKCIHAMHHMEVDIEKTWQLATSNIGSHEKRDYLNCFKESDG